MRLFGVSHEELRLVRVRVISRICHRDYASCVELGRCGSDQELLALRWTYFQRRPDLIRERRAPDALTTFACPSRVSSLDNKASDVAMKDAPIIVARRTKCEEILEGRLLAQRD